MYSCSVHTVRVEAGSVLAFWGVVCGVLSCLEETWEERQGEGRRRRKEAVGTSERNSFTLVSTYISDWLKEGPCECDRMTTWVLSSPRKVFVIVTVAKATETTDYREKADTPLGG